MGHRPDLQCPFRVSLPELLPRPRFIEETGTDKAVLLVMISAAGVVSNSYAGELQRILTLDDLFADYSEV